MRKSIWKVYQNSTKRLVFIGNKASDVAEYLHVSESWVRNMASKRYDARYGTKSRQNTGCLKYHYTIISEPIPRQTKEERLAYSREWQKKRYYENKKKEFMEVFEKCM